MSGLLGKKENMQNIELNNKDYEIDQDIKTRFADKIEYIYEYLSNNENIDSIKNLGNDKYDINLVHKGKVRDSYLLDDDKRIMLATNRLSAFDRSICQVPFKGQLLNQLSAWWFENTKHIIKNHCLAVPHPQMILCNSVKVLPVEAVVRSYLTGSTNTAIWTRYNSGQREFFGVKLKDNLTKNTKLERPILDPTSKSDIHDEPMSKDDILAHQAIAPYWDKIEKAALELFNFGQQKAEDAGLILVDTKYEFGVTQDGELILIDECHTSDSSRYWDLKSWEQDQANPKAFDKELMRLWVRKNCDPYKDAQLPKIPVELVAYLSSQYISLYEKITGKAFIPEMALGSELNEKLKQAAVSCVNKV